jgi:hypothetical protein
VVSTTAATAVIVAAAAAAVFTAAVTAAARTRVIPPSPMPAMIVRCFSGAILLPVFTAIFLAGRLARLASHCLGASQRSEGCRDGGDENAVLHEQVSKMTQ